MAESSKKKSILADHKKVRNRFIPPFVQSIPNMEYVRWKNTGLPELVWLGLLDYELGLKEAARLSVVLAQTTKSIVGSSTISWFAPITSYSTLSENEQILVVEELRKTDDLSKLRKALLLLVYFYPRIPLKFLFADEKLSVENDFESLEKFKRFLSEYSLKYGKRATLAQANAIYIAFVTDVFKVVKGSSALENFPAIEDFPNTEESKRVATSIYPTANMFLGQLAKEFGEAGLTLWATYFWNQGLKLEACSFGFGSGQYGSR